jgi:hypothetical protein
VLHKQYCLISVELGEISMYSKSKVIILILNAKQSSSGRIIPFETVDIQFIKKGLSVPVLLRQKTEYTIGL